MKNTYAINNAHFNWAAQNADNIHPEDHGGGCDYLCVLVDFEHVAILADATPESCGSPSRDDDSDPMGWECEVVLMTLDDGGCGAFVEGVTLYRSSAARCLTFMRDLVCVADDHLPEDALFAVYGEGEPDRLLRRDDLTMDNGFVLYDFFRACDLKVGDAHNMKGETIIHRIR